MKDERLVSKMEGKINFSRSLKQFDGLTWLTRPPYFTTDLRHCACEATFVHSTPSKRDQI